MPVADTTSSALINALSNPPNWAERAGQAATAAQLIQQNRANQAAAEAYRQAVDPVTGEVDQNKFNAALIQQPGGGYNFGQGMQSIGQGVEAQGRGTTAQVQANVDQLGAASQFMYPLVIKASDPNAVISPAEVQATMDQAHQLGLINNQQYNNVTGALQKLGPNGNARGVVLGSFMGNQAVRSAATGNPGYVNNGYGNVPVQQSPYGAPPTAPYIPSGPSPGQQMQQQQWLDQRVPDWINPDTHQNQSGTLRQFYGAYHIPIESLMPFGPIRPNAQGQVVLPAIGGAPSVTITVPQAPAAAPPTAEPTGRPAVPPPGTPLPPPPAAAPVVPPAANTPLPGQVSAGVDAYNQTNAAVEGSAQRILAMQQAQKALEGAPTGPNTEFTSKVNGFLDTWGPLIGLAPGTKASDRAEAEKYLQQIANVGFAGGPPGTNDKLAAAVTANPSVHIPKMAAQDVLDVMIGQEQLQQHIFRLAQQQNIAPVDFAKFRANWFANHDPRAFIPLTIGPDASKDEITRRQKTLQYLNKTMPAGSAERKKFNDTVAEIAKTNAAPMAVTAPNMTPAPEAPEPPPIPPVPIPPGGESYTPGNP